MMKSTRLIYLLIIAINSMSLPARASEHVPPRRQTSAIAAMLTLQQTDAARDALERGRQLLRRGNAEQALVALEGARKDFAKEGNAKGEATANDALGDLYNLQGQYKVALDYYHQANKLFRASDDAYNADLMLAKIGDMYYRRGEINEASAAYSQMNVQKPDTNALNAYNAAKSKVNHAKGLFGRVRDLATATPSTSTASNAASVGTDAASEVKGKRDLYRRFIIYAIYELGMGRMAYFAGADTDAREHFENALAAAGGNLPVIGNLGQTRRFRIAARTSLGDIALRAGRFTEALKFYTDASEGAERDNRIDLIWPAKRGIGKTLWLQAAQEKDAARAAKNREAALIAYRDAIKTIEALRAGSISADESRSTFLATTKDVYDEASSALAEMALMNASPTANAGLQGAALDYTAEAFRIVEQSRARSLLDMLGEAATNITEGVPAELLERRQANLDRQQQIAQELTGVNLASDTAAQSNEALESELDKLATEYDRLENEIRAASPRYAALTQPQPVTLAEAQQSVLDDQTALVEYSLGAKNSYLWAVTRNSVVLYRIPARNEVERLALEMRAQTIPAKLRTTALTGIDMAAISQLPQAQRGLSLAAMATAPVDSAAVARFAAAANALYKAVVEPASSLIGDKRLLVVADGALNYVPFEAFVTKLGDASDYVSLSYLIKTNEIVYAPSASVIAVIRGATNKNIGRGVLLVADPIFSENDPRARVHNNTKAQDETNEAARGLGLASALTDIASASEDQAKTTGSMTAPTLQLARLSGTRAEAETVAQLARKADVPADMWLDLDANEANIETRDIRKYRIVHIATHGVLDSERPQFTGLILSLVGNKTGDGFLRTGEVFNLRLGAPLVMLSACETGLGREKRGEGIIGLTRAFMYAGAPTVGVSLWSVADRSTAELMTDFYQRLLVGGQNTSPTSAMRSAQLAMIAGKRYSAPFYWAPFVLVGEWK
jgi:CHAT domain-containing protein